MNREERLSHVVSQLDADERYATGSRRFPGYVNKDDAMAIAEALAEEFDAGAARRAEAAARQGMTIVCKPGCNHCCTVVPMVYRPDALRIARWLLEPAPENQAAREAFLAAYPAWRAQLGDGVEKLPELF